MRDLLDQVLLRHGGVVSRATLFLAGVPRHVIDGEVRAGRLVAVMPRTYCRQWDADLNDVRELAALVSVGRPAALSHLSALRGWGLVPASPAVHVTVPRRRNPVGSPDLIVHRVTRVPPATLLGGRPVVAPAFAVASSWPMLPVEDRRAPAITAVRTRLVQPDDLRSALDLLPRLPGRRALAGLVDLLAAGCESELEIWGHSAVFDVPGLAHATTQKWVFAGGTWHRLDRAYEEERVAVELDGRRFHDSYPQRERDRRRDAALAAAGWQTLRFSHDRLHRDVDGCRRDTLATLAARRRLAG